MQNHMEQCWRSLSDVVITPDATTINWDGFTSAAQLIEAGERAAREALPAIMACPPAKPKISA
jgi:hypothetical protein